MLNREYQKRATRQGIRTFLATEFYRPARRPDPRPARHAPKSGEQLVLNFELRNGRFRSDEEYPLGDIFPEAY